MSSPSYGAGGFLQAHQLLSPPPSSVDSSSTAGSLLPEPRSRALRSGGAKETALMNYMDRNITQINRRYAMKYSVNTDGDGLFRGYNNFSEIVKDVDKLVDIVWVSGTSVYPRNWSQFHVNPHKLTFADSLTTGHVSTFPRSPFNYIYASFPCGSTVYVSPAR